ncbi:hypothetical protein CHS0354_035272 [Potamilus streckersoni]|uniref:Uncharacterized protein n=1 Tax=Potamilus streckersoni TaxID=2493646 RepID=A0AAE0VNK0_9BIVA|nr:hypothetical protein CHS0354_035272 [Potamilus streckersoni]
MDTAPLSKKDSIVVESEKILREMKHEISALEDRVKLLEKENSETSILKEQLQINRRLNDRLFSKIDGDRRDTDKNMQVLSDLMGELKDPIHQVVDNLTAWSESIKDDDIRSSFKQFCRSLKPEDLTYTENLNIRKCLKDKLTSAFENPSKFKLLVDKNIPEFITVHKAIMESAIEKVLKTLLNPENHDKQIMISILKKDAGSDFPEEQIQLIIRVMSDKQTEMTWKEDWHESVDISGTKKDMLPIEWLETKNQLRHLNGNLYILSKESRVIGSEIHIPLR